MARAKQVPEAEGSSRTRRDGCASAGAPLCGGRVVAWVGSRAVEGTAQIAEQGLGMC